MFWPSEIVQTAKQDRPAPSWQVGKLSQDEKKLVAPQCQTELTNNRIYVKAWKHFQAHILPDTSNLFFDSPMLTLLRKCTLSRLDIL